SDHTNRVSRASALEPPHQRRLRKLRLERAGRAPRSRLAALLAPRATARRGKGQRGTGLLLACRRRGRPDFERKRAENPGARDGPDRTPCRSLPRALADRNGGSVDFAAFPC